MEVIHKIQLNHVDEQTVMLPMGATLLSVQDQDGILTVWYRCHPEDPKQAVSFRIYGTGHAIVDRFDGRYLGTVQQDYGALVWHVFYQPL